MAVLNNMVIAAAACAGCYSPELRDCTVPCEGTGECASGQVCGSDHFCAAPARAGACMSATGPDAAVAIDASPLSPDAEDTIELNIHIDGHGLVALDGGDTCSAHDCTLLAPRGLPATLHAIAAGDDEFDRWTTPICALQSATCTFVALVDSDVGVRFRKADP